MGVMQTNALRFIQQGPLSPLTFLSVFIQHDFSSISITVTVSHLLPMLTSILAPLCINFGILQPPAKTELPTITIKNTTTINTMIFFIFLPLYKVIVLQRWIISPPNVEVSGNNRQTTTKFIQNLSCVEAFNSVTISVPISINFTWYLFSISIQTCFSTSSTWSSKKPHAYIRRKTPNDISIPPHYNSYEYTWSSLYIYAASSGDISSNIGIILKH